MVEVIDIRMMQGKAMLTLSDNTVVKIPYALYRNNKYRLGDSFDMEAHLRYVGEKAYAAAMEKAVKLLSLREMTQDTIANKLRTAWYDEETIARVMQMLTNYRLVDDARYASMYVASRSKKYGSNRVKMELRNKGVDADLIAKELENIDTESECALALRHATKLVKNKEKNQKNMHNAMASLIRKGFSFSIAKEALQTAFQDAVDFDSLTEEVDY